MKLVFLDTTMNGSLIGGAHTFMHTLIRGFVGRGHEVHFVTNGVPTAKTALGIDNCGAKMHTDLWKPDALVEDSAPVLANWINELGPDIFLISTSADIGWVVLPLLNSSIATVTIGHNDSPTYYDPGSHYRDFLTRTVGVSSEICEKYWSESCVEKESIAWIPYGVKTADSPPSESENGPLKLVYVGRVEDEQKRFSDLVGVVKALSAAGMDFLFQVVGDGVSMPIVKQQLAGEIASGQVVLHGWLESEKVLDVVRDSEVFVLASAYEGFCIALVEAMANGCAPVVTDIRSGNKQLVEDGNNGFIVPVGDIAAFADKIQVLAEDREKLLDFRRRAWETGREYGVERMVEAYENCFLKAIEDTKAHHRRPDPDFPLMESCRSKYPLWLRRIKARLVNSE